MTEDDSKEENWGSEDDNCEVFSDEKASATADISLKRSYLQRRLPYTVYRYAFSSPLSPNLFLQPFPLWGLHPSKPRGLGKMWNPASNSFRCKCVVVSEWKDTLFSKFAICWCSLSMKHANKLARSQESYSASVLDRHVTWLRRLALEGGQNFQGNSYA